MYRLAGCLFTTLVSDSFIVPFRTVWPPTKEKENEKVWGPYIMAGKLLPYVGHVCDGKDKLDLSPFLYRRHKSYD